MNCLWLLKYRCRFCRHKFEASAGLSSHEKRCMGHRFFLTRGVYARASAQAAQTYDMRTNRGALAAYLKYRTRMASIGIALAVLLVAVRVLLFVVNMPAAVSIPLDTVSILLAVGLFTIQLSTYREMRYKVGKLVDHL